MSELVEIRSGVELPSVRTEFNLQTEDGLNLVGELAMPISKSPDATLITLHPLPTHGGFMDSHVFKKAANRLPTLANLAVLRFNTRGTESPRGKSEGEFGDGISEVYDVRAAVHYAQSLGLKNLWLVGWSFGTELALKYGLEHDVEGIILLSPPLRRTTNEELLRWSSAVKKIVAIVPELDDYLRPEEAKMRFAPIPQAEVLGIDGAKHLWVGEVSTARVLNEIVRITNPKRYPLPTVWQQ